MGEEQLKQILSFIGVFAIGGAVGWEGAHWVSIDLADVNDGAEEVLVTRSAVTPALVPEIPKAPDTPQSEQVAVKPAAPTPTPVPEAKVEPAVKKVETAVEETPSLEELNEKYAKYSEVEVTPVQRKILDGILRNARQSNEGNRDTVVDGMVLDHIAVRGLKINYYYTIQRPFALIDVDDITQQKTAAIKSSLCGNETVRLLETEYGIFYEYNFLSSDNRLVAHIDGNLGPLCK